ncbi:MAG: hypothetical protein JRI25_22810 [Deltaproteobacteria bacterium]|nr:hypothetical protein [Deltaproteobacteria bacterium]
MQGISGLVGAAALGAFALVPLAGWAGTSSGLGSDTPPVNRELDLEVDVLCAISVNIVPATSETGLAADQTQLVGAFSDNTPDDDTDEIDFGTVNLLAGTTTLDYGGDAYDFSSDSSMNVIGGINVTITHTCGTTAPTANITSSVDAIGSTTVRWTNAHVGGSSGWLTNEYTLLNIAGSGFTFTNGSPMPVDLGFNIPKTTTSSATPITATVKFATVGGS